MQGDKLKNPLLNDDSYELPQDNLLFQEEKKNLTFKSILKGRWEKKRKIFKNNIQLLKKKANL